MRLPNMLAFRINDGNCKVIRFDIDKNTNGSLN